MKKRIVALFLVLAVLCTCVLFTACDDEKEAPKTEPIKKSDAAVINDALNKSNSLDSISAVMEAEINMEMEGMTMSIPLNAKIKAKNLNSDNVISYSDITMSMLGQELTMQMYQEGQWAYMIMDDIKYKCSLEDMESEMDYANNAKDILKEIPEDQLKDVKLVKAEDGSETATITLSGDKFSELYSELVKTVNSEVGAEFEELKSSDAVINITIADGYITVFDVAFTMDMTVDGFTTTVKAKETITYENPGQEVTITPPEGYQNFEELDMGDDTLL